jgi:O-antigen/teichoic acid export membrane protein
MITVFLIPVYTRIFTPSDYGVMNIITNVLSACALFAVFGLDSAAARWYYDSDDLADRKSTLSSWFYFQTIVSTVFVVLMLVSTPLVLKYLLKDSDKGNYLQCIIDYLSLLTMIMPKLIKSLFRF